MSVDTELPSHLVETLEQLGYLGDDGLITVSTPEDPGPRHYVWQDLRDKVGLDAVFFKDGVPLVGFTGHTEGQGLAAVRSRLWNYGRLPVLLAASPDTVTAYNALDSGTRIDDADSGILKRDPRHAISRQLLDSFERSAVMAGGFVDHHAAAYANAARVDTALLVNLQHLRQKNSTPGTERRTATDALIGASLLASYLADRDILNVDHLNSMTGKSSLDDVLMGGKASTVRLFEGLADHFNGDVFGPVPRYLTSLDEHIIYEVAALLRGDDLISGQASLWPYDFAVLPADLVSNIYERLLEESRKADAAYYTPHFLVHVLLDEVLPWDQSDEPSVMDPACGSGAFITEAFRRLCYRARVRLGRDLSYSELQNLLCKKIFGIDSNPVAARTTVFGLYLTLLEQLTPPTAWATAVLPRLLHKNILVSDAFERNSLSDQRFDIVIGNPPWKSKLTEPAARYVHRTSSPVADKQIAQAFLWLARDLAKPGGAVGLIMPSKPLLHNKRKGTLEFRKAVFEGLDVRTIIDLSAIRRSIFHTAIGPAAVIVAKTLEYGNEVDFSEEILYASPHYRPINDVVDALVITPEEVRSVSKKQAVARPDIWKVYLWGGPRDTSLIERIRISHPSLGEIVSEKGWVISRGYESTGPDAIDSSFMQGLPEVPTRSIQRLHLDSTSFVSFDQPYLHRPRHKALYRAPHVLIRRTPVDGRLAAVLHDQDAVFKNNILGLAGPSEDRDLLAAISGIISSSFASYWHFMTSSTWGVERDALELNEHLTLPLPLNDAQLLQAIVDIVSEARDGVDAELLERLDSAVFDAYVLTENERTRVRDRVTTRMDAFRSPKRYAIAATQDDLSFYVRILQAELKYAFPFFSLETAFQRSRSYCAVAIGLGPARSRPAAAFAIDISSILRISGSTTAEPLGIFAQPAGFYVDEDTIYIVKTVDRDRWSMDSAIDDAGRIFSALAFGGERA